MTAQPPRPAPARHAALAAGFGLGLAAITALSLSLRFGWAQPAQIAALSAIFGFGGALALGVSAALAWWALPRSRPGLRIVVIAVLTLLGAFAFTGGMLALGYRSYYGQWHAAPFTRLWMWQQVFTAAAAVYQYAVIGPRLYGLESLALLALASWRAGRAVR